MPKKPKVHNPELPIKASGIVSKLSGLTMYVDYAPTREQYYRDRYGEEAP